MSWEGSVFLVPPAEKNRIQQVVEELERYADACTSRPRRHIVVSPVERIL